MSKKRVREFSISIATLILKDKEFTFTDVIHQALKVENYINNGINKMAIEDMYAAREEMAKQLTECDELIEIVKNKI